MIHFDFDKLDKLKKLIKISNLITEEYIPSDKKGYKFHVYYFDGKEASREYEKDDAFQEATGTYENPILFVKGMEVDKGSWYYVPNHKDIPIECIKSGICDSIYNDEYLDIIPGFIFEGYSEEESLDI